MMYEKEIQDCHPLKTDDLKGYRADCKAQLLIGERHSKVDLIDLVRWLILDKAKIVNKDI